MGYHVTVVGYEQIDSYVRQDVPEGQARHLAQDVHLDPKIRAISILEDGIRTVFNAMRPRQGMSMKISVDDLRKQTGPPIERVGRNLDRAGYKKTEV
ncbi:MAG: hypothetical protein ABIH67_03650 [Candidatus Uhrbacteria bacterium]